MIKYSIYTPGGGIKDAGRNAGLRPGTVGASRIMEFATLSFVDCEGTETHRVVTSIHSCIAGLPEKRLTASRCASHGRETFPASKSFLLQALASEEPASRHYMPGNGFDQQHSLIETS